MFLLKLLKIYALVFLLSLVIKRNNGSIIIKGGSGDQISSGSGDQNSSGSVHRRQGNTSKAYKYFMQYWQNVPPNKFDYCKDFSQYVCPPIQKERGTREERSNEWDGSLDSLDGIVPDAAGYGFYEYMAARKTILNYWDKKYNADNRPAWQKNMKAFYDKCEQYMTAGGVKSDGKFSAFKDEIERNTTALFAGLDGIGLPKVIAQMQRDYSSFVSFPFFPWKIETLKDEPGANVPYKIKIVEEEHRDPTKWNLCRVYTMLRHSKGNRALSNILVAAVSSIYDGRIRLIGGKACMILGWNWWPVDTANPGSFEKSFSDLPSLATAAQTEAEKAGFCTSDNKWHKNFDLRIYLNEVLSETFSNDKKVKISSKHLVTKIMSILCELELWYNSGELKNFWNDKFINLLNANLGTENNCKKIFFVYAPDVIAYEADERAKANDDISKSYWSYGFRSGVVMEKIMEVLKDGGVSEAQIVDLKRRLSSLVVEMPQSGTDYLENNYGANFPTGDYFPRLLLAVQKYNSARNMKPHERDIAYGMSMFIKGPYFAQEVPVFHDVPLRSMFVGAMFSSPPYYDRSLPTFMLYANAVFILAHEMAHALDMPVDSPIHTGFKDFKQCLVNEYSRHNIVDNNSLLKVDGRATLAENFADYIAWRAAKKAYDDVKNLPAAVPADKDWEKWNKDKLFFMAGGANYATCISAMKLNDTLLWAHQVRYVHTFGKNRVNVAFELWPEFAKIWKCGPETPMGHENDKCEKLFKI